MKKWMLLIGVTITSIYYSYSQNSNNYVIEINKKLWKTEPINAKEHFDKKYLNDGNLYIHFQSAFDSDSTEIKINGEFYGKYCLTTDWSTELADVIVVPKFKTIKAVCISINGGNEAVFELKEMNQIIVRLRKEKLLIGFRKHVPYYN